VLDTSHITSHNKGMKESPGTAWQLQQAKARFSEFLDAALRLGPQVVTRRGIAEAVLVPIEEWRRRQRNSVPDIKRLLLGDGPRFEGITPARGILRRRQTQGVE
jgi:antitoxin Phd